MIGVAAPVFDIDGAVKLKNIDADFDTTSRRISRTATIDGGAYVSDQGYSDADLIINIKARDLTNAEAIMIRELVQNYGTLVATTPRAAYTVAPFSFSYRGGVASLVLYVREKISE